MHAQAFALVSALAAMSAGGIWAQAGDVAIDLGKAVVEGSLTAPSALSPTAASVTLETDDIARSGADNLADLVSAVGGLEVKSYGNPGSARTASIRGGAGGHVVVVLDGVRLADARTGWLDLSTIPLAGIEKVEILRSGASALYGSDAIAGVIFLTSARSGAPALKVSAETVAYPLAYPEGADSLAAAQKISASGRAALGGATATVSGGFERAADTLVAADADSGYTTRGNAGMLAAWADAGLVSGIGTGIGKASVFGRYADKGVPGSLSYPSPGATQTEYEARGIASWSKDDAFGGAAAVETALSAVWSRMRYVDPDYLTDDTHDSIGGSLRAAGEAAFGPVVAKAGLVGAVDAASSTKIGDRSRLSAGAYLAPELRLREFVVAPSARMDLYSDVEPGLSYGVGFSWTKAGFSLKLNGASAYKAPSFSDLYWPEDAYTAGNPDLESERSWSGELGLGYAAKLGRAALSLSVSPYLRYVDEMIAWVDSDGWMGPEPSRPENIDAAAYAGGDSAIEASIGPISASVSYSYTLAKDLTGGVAFAEAERLAYTPLHEVGASLGVKSGPASLSVDASFRAGRLDGYGEALDDVLLLGMKAAYGLKGGVSIGLELANLLNVEYVEYSDYPMPGFSATVSVTLSR